jgi:hypothetical protein
LELIASDVRRRPKRPIVDLSASCASPRQLGSPSASGFQARILSIVGNAIIVWNTVYTQQVLDELRGAGELITTSEIEHISPLAHQHIHLYGHYPFDLRQPTHPATGHSERNQRLPVGCDLQRFAPSIP